MSHDSRLAVRSAHRIGAAFATCMLDFISGTQHPTEKQFAEADVRREMIVGVSLSSSLTHGTQSLFVCWSVRSLVNLFVLILSAICCATLVHACVHDITYVFSRSLVWLPICLVFVCRGFPCGLHRSRHL